MEFDVENKVLCDALLVSGIGNKIAIRTLSDRNGKINGIFFNSRVNITDSTGIVVNYGILGSQIRFVEFGVRNALKWPHVLFSCTDRLVRAVESLPTGEENKLKVRIFQKTVDKEKVDVESRVIICGAGKANIELRTQHPIVPLEPGETESAKTSCYSVEFLEECS